MSKTNKIEYVDELNSSDNFDDKHNLIDLVNRINHIENLNSTLDDLKTNSYKYAQSFLKTQLFSKSEILKRIPESQYNEYKIAPKLITLLNFGLDLNITDYDFTDIDKQIKHYKTCISELTADSKKSSKKTWSVNTPCYLEVQDSKFTEQIDMRKTVLERYIEDKKNIKKTLSALPFKLDAVTSSDDKIFVIDSKNKTIDMCFYFADISKMYVSINSKFKLAFLCKTIKNKTTGWRDFDYSYEKDTNTTRFNVDAKRKTISITDEILYIYNDEVPTHDAVLISGNYWNRTTPVERSMSFELIHNFCLKTNTYIGNNIDTLLSKINKTRVSNSRYPNSSSKI